jgi:hypothetical protein
MSQWQRETDLTIPKDVHDSMAPVSVSRRFLHQSASVWFRLLMKEKYVQHVLRYKIPLSIEEKEPTYLTIENYVAMEEFLVRLSPISQHPM